MNVIVFSPHPDDAEILMGGTIAQYTQKGHDVLMVLVTVPSRKEERIQESKKSAAILGARLLILDANPYEMTFNRNLVETFDSVMQDFLPDIIYTSWINDSHQDHVTVAKTTIATARKNDCSLYMYEQALPSGVTPYAFRTQAFVDISNTFEIKMRSLSAYQSQAQKYGEQWLQGIAARATYLGVRINRRYAEAFEVIREITQI